MATAHIHSYVPAKVLAEEIGRRVPQVVKIFAFQNGTEVSFWTVIEGYDGDVRSRIYQIEKELFRHHPCMKFDFHTIEGDGSTEITDAELVYIR